MSAALDIYGQPPRDNNRELAPNIDLSAKIVHIVRRSAQIRSVRSHTFAEGEPLYRNGFPAEHIYFVESGVVKLVSLLENGRSRIIRIHNDGDVIGMDALFQSVATNVAIAMRPTRATAVPVAVFQSLQADDPQRFCELLKELYRHLALAETWITEFSTGGIRERAARLVQFLLQLDNDQSPHIVLPKNEDIAETLGVTVESASRTMAQFKREQLITRTGSPHAHRYRVDPDRLTREIASAL